MPISTTAKVATAFGGGIVATGAVVTALPVVATVAALVTSALLLKNADALGDLASAKIGEKRANDVLDLANRKYEKALRDSRNPNGANSKGSIGVTGNSNYTPPFTGGQVANRNYFINVYQTSQGNRFLRMQLSGVGAISGSGLINQDEGNIAQGGFEFIFGNGQIFNGGLYQYTRGTSGDDGSSLGDFEVEIYDSFGRDTQGSPANLNPPNRAYSPPLDSSPNSNPFPYSPSVQVRSEAPIPQAYPEPPIPKAPNFTSSPSPLTQPNYDNRPFKEPVKPVYAPVPVPVTAPVSPLANTSPSYTPPPLKRPNSGESQPYASPFVDGGAFTARPFVSGISDPSEYGNPRDEKTGLTRQEFEAAKQAKVNEPIIRAANYDAKVMEEQLRNLSTVVPNGATKSPQQVQREQYEKTISGDAIKEAAYQTAQTKASITPVAQPVTKPTTTTPNTPNQGDSNDTIKILAGLTGLGLLIATIKGLNDQINNQTKPIAQQTNAKQGVCDAMQPQQCGFEGVKQATTEATQPIANQTTANAGLLANVLSAIANLASTIANLFSNVTGIVTRILNNQFVHSSLSFMTNMTVLHNAAMLSRDVGETLGTVVDNAINLSGQKLKDKDGGDVDFSSWVGTNIRAVIIQVIGVDKYVQLALQWQKASTIYHSAMAVVNTTQSMLDPISGAVEYGMENVSRIGNGLREDGVVSENSYKAMDETIRARRVNRFERLNDTLEGAENISSNLASVTSSAVSVKEDYKQLREDTKDLKDKAVAYNATDETARTELKASLPTQITPVTLAPAPSEEEP